MKGQIISIHITHAGGQPMVSVSEVRAVPGKGLEGDRYYNQQGYYSDKPGTGRELTLIESEALEYLGEHSGIQLTAGEPRRNLVTRGVQLNPLIGKVFRVGEVTVRGVRLCDPCSYLEGLTQPGVLAGLVERGGLRAEILSEGTIRAGDPITA